MKFASSTVAEQGCGIVAAHNALKALGKGQKLSELVFYFDKKMGTLVTFGLRPIGMLQGA